MKNQYTAWAIRLADGSLVPALFGMPGPLILRTKQEARYEVRGRKSVKWEPGTVVRVTVTVREVVK
jgi:hypothetical protein